MAKSLRPRVKMVQIPAAVYERLCREAAECMMHREALRCMMEDDAREGRPLRLHYNNTRLLLDGVQRSLEYEALARGETFPPGRIEALYG